MGSLRLERFKQDRDALLLAVQAMEQSPSPDKQLTASLARAIVWIMPGQCMPPQAGKPKPSANRQRVVIGLNLLCQLQCAVASAPL